MLSLELEEDAVPWGQGVIGVDLDKTSSQGCPGSVVAGDLEQDEALERRQGVSLPSGRRNSPASKLSLATVRVV